MRYILSLLIFIGLTVFQSNAQVTLKPGVGVNFMDFSKSPTTGEYKSQTGYQIGGSVAFGQKFYVEPGFFYGKKSVKYQSGTTGISDADYKLNGIRIPVAVGFPILNKNKGLLGVRALGGFSAFILTDIENFDMDDFNKATWGVFAGAGLDISMFFLDIQYEWSLSEVSDDLSAVDVGKSRSLFLTAGVRIVL